MYMHAISDRDSRTGISFVGVFMPVLKHHETFRVVDVTSVLGRNRGRSNIETLMHVSVRKGSVINGPVVMIGNESGNEIILRNFQWEHLPLGFYPNIFLRKMSL